MIIMMTILTRSLRGIFMIIFHFSWKALSLTIIMIVIVCIMKSFQRSTHGIVSLAFYHSTRHLYEVYRSVEKEKASYSIFDRTCMIIYHLVGKSLSLTMIVIVIDSIIKTIQRSTHGVVSWAFCHSVGHLYEVCGSVEKE